jgi:hypothetical protein
MNHFTALKNLSPFYVTFFLHLPYQPFTSLHFAIYIYNSLPFPSLHFFTFYHLHFTSLHFPLLFDRKSNNMAARTVLEVDVGEFVVRKSVPVCLSVCMQQHLINIDNAKY